MKHLNLLKLKNNFDIPEFFVIPPEVLFTAFKNTNPDGRKKLLNYLSSNIPDGFFNHPYGFLIRSSFSVEGDLSKSYSGLFKTVFLRNKNQILNSIENVFMSLFTKEISSYERKTKKIIPYIMIQKYIKGVSGSGFIDIVNREYYAEWLENSKLNYIISRNGFSYVSDFKIYKSKFLLIPLFFQNSHIIEKILHFKRFSFEFVISEDKFYLLQVNKTNQVKFNSLLIKYENEENYDFSCRDFDANFFNMLLKLIDINRKISPVMKSNEVFIKYDDISVIDDEFKKISYYQFEKFKKFVISFYHNSLLKLKEKKDKFKLLREFKKFNFNISVINFIYTRFLYYLSAQGNKRINEIISFKKEIKKYEYLISDFYHKKISSQFKINSYNEIKKLILMPGEKNKAKLEILTSKENTKKNELRINPKFPLTGICLSPGKTKGKIIIINRETDFNKIREDNIIVSNYLDSTLAKGILKACGVITAVGGYFSHASIIARELKKPCVGGIYGCEYIFKNGDIVEIDNEKILRL